MHLNAGADLLEIAVEQGHLSIEIAFDAILVETGTWNIDSLGFAAHNLKRLADALVSGRELINEELTSAPATIRADFRAVSTAWRMQYRYKPVPWELPKMQEFIPVFERLFQWILINFRKPVSN
jgi:hypothetical protein